MTKAVGWRYILQRWNYLTGWTVQDLSLDLDNVSITRTLSGINQLTGTIPIEILTLMNDDGTAMFDPWSSAIWAEVDGVIRGGGVLKDVTFTGSSATLTCAGFACYPFGQYYGGSKLFVKADPLDIVRHIYDYVQHAEAGGNIGLQLDDTKSPVRIGTVLVVDTSQTPSGDISLESGPYRLSWYETADLGDAINGLSASTPFDYVEDNSWTDSTRTEVKSFLRLGYPKLGRRHFAAENSPIFEVGVNVTTPWDYQETGDDYANEVLVRGKGEGRVAIHRTAARVFHNRLRRRVLIDEKRASTNRLALQLAQITLANRMSAGDISQMVVTEHPQAPLGSYDVGDEILLVASSGWRAKNRQWHRIMSMEMTPDNGGTVTVSLSAVERTVRFPTAVTTGTP